MALFGGKGHKAFLDQQYISQINSNLYEAFSKFLCGDGEQLYVSSIFCIGPFQWPKATELF